jgi:serine/threonine-protein kinase
MALLAGTVIAGRYVLEDELGHGGMGTVYRARHVALGTPVAVKLLDPHLTANEEALQRFLREAQAAATLRGPDIVQVLDYGIHDGVPYMVMELLEGETLAQRRRRSKTMSPTETAAILGQVAEALERAHRAGIVHRDLTPDNVFVTDVGSDAERVKLIDFGIAKWNGPASPIAGVATRAGVLLGTPHYMSPEQIQGESFVDYRTDIWALGVIAFECLLGHLPFDGETLAKLAIQICEQPPPVPSAVGRVPDGFDAWFARAVAHERDERFASASRAGEELALLCRAFSHSLDGHTHVAASERGMTREGRHSPERHSGLGRPAAAVGALVLVASGAIALALSQRADGRREEPPSRAVIVVSSQSPASAPSTKAAPAAPAAGEHLPSPVVGAKEVLASELGVRLALPDEVSLPTGRNTFASADGAARVVVHALRPTMTLEEEYTAATQATPSRSVEYRVLRDGWYVVSGYTGEAIYYDKVVQNGEGRNVALSISFPRLHKARFEQVVERLSHSFRAY